MTNHEARVIYVTPNTAHHFGFAAELARAGLLKCLVSGVPRMHRAYRPLRSAGVKVIYGDFLQSLFLAVRRLRAGARLTDWLGYVAKLELGRRAAGVMTSGDAVVFYNGAGGGICEKARRVGATTVVEVVNSHVLNLAAEMNREFSLCGLPAQGMYERDVRRRQAEYQTVDYVMGPSEYVKQSFLARGWPAERFLKVRYGYNLFSNRQLQGRSERKEKGVFTVLFVGLVQPRKGLRYLLAAFERLQLDRKRLLLVGGVGQPSGIEGLKIPPDVEFLGIKKGEELADCYEAADVFVLPSVEEGFGLVLIEAMSFGVPVVASTSTGFADVCEDGVEGFSVAPRDVDGLADRLAKLAVDGILRERMGHKALERARQMNGWAESGRELRETIGGLLGKCRSE